MRIRLLVVIGIALLASGGEAQVLFQDDFEVGFTPGWYGRFDVFEITTDNAHSGTHAVTTNGRWHWLAVDLGAPQSNTTYQVWFYDAGTDREEHMMGVSPVDPCCGSQPILWIGLETFFDNANYMYGRGFEEVSSNVSRSVGWHLATFFTDGVTTQLFIDGALVSTETFGIGWRYIVIWENSKWPEPHPPNYWDDVAVYANEPVGLVETGWGTVKTLFR